MICEAPPELPPGLHPAARAVLEAERRAQLARHPAEMRDEGIDWTDDDGNEWRVYRCPICGRVNEAL